MKPTSNPSTGRHGIGSQVGKFTSNKPSQGASGNYGVGTGRNQKTAGRAAYKGTQPRSGTDSQPESFVNQSPSPWDNSQPSSNPTSGAPDTVQAPGWGQPYEQTSAPENPPTRSPGQKVMGQSSMDEATGHSGGKGAGRTGRNRSVISGQPLEARKAKNVDNAGQPISAAQARFNRDFWAAAAELKNTGGLS